jgi:hypothetical protein
VSFPKAVKKIDRHRARQAEAPAFLTVKAR